MDRSAKNSPQKIVKYHVNPLDEFIPYEARGIAIKMGVPNQMISQMAGFIWKLFNIYI